uniref:Uncharacterized protein n=1 Tax=Anopheles quadriannulatus TaxID=34691 RepID=A0A182XQB9_ANOQN
MTFGGWLGCLFGGERLRTKSLVLLTVNFPFSPKTKLPAKSASVSQSHFAPVVWSVCVCVYLCVFVCFSSCCCRSPVVCVLPVTLFCVLVCLFLCLCSLLVPCFMFLLVTVSVIVMSSFFCFRYLKVV